MLDHEPANIPTPQTTAKDPEGVLARHHHAGLNEIQLRLLLGSFRAEFLGWGFIDGAKWWRNYMHAHTYYEICYAFAGRGLFRMLGTDYTVKRGDVFIAKPREDHEIIADEADPLGIFFWSYTLTPESSPKPAETLISPHLRARDAALDWLLHAFVESKRWVSARVPGMDQTLELMREEAVRREPGYLGLLEGLAAKLILDTARASLDDPLPGEDVPGRVSDPKKALAQQATRYMRDNLARPLSIQDIAAQVNLSERHFTRLFTQLAGHSPLEALTQIRLETAQQLLLDPAIPIKEIAERVGFPDVRYFTTVFRKKTGVPPAEYRARGGTRFRDPERGHHGAAKPGHEIGKEAKRKA